jgi:hypothetical protein
MNEPKRELLNLIRSKLSDGMTPYEVVDAIARIFYEVGDDWEEIEVTTLGSPDRELLDQRWLIARIPREAVQRTVRRPDRTVGISG